MDVMAVEHRHRMLPANPYDLWMRNELADLLDLPHDGTRAEIIGGEIVVAPGPDFAHNMIVSEIQRPFEAAIAADLSFPWRCVQTQDVDLSDIHDGYIPDLCVLDKDVARRARIEVLGKIVPVQLALAVEVTSPSTAVEDRRPGTRRARPSKWNGYARVGIGYYLLVDRDPEVAAATLFTDPDPELGGYRAWTSWKFGDTIELPETFGVSVGTHDWAPWE